MCWRIIEKFQMFRFFQKFVEKRRGVPNSYASFLRLGYGLTIIFFCLGVGWAAVTSISGAVVASGSIAIRGDIKTLQHLDGGIVQKLLVEEGQSVSAGEVLIVLDDTLLDANRAIILSRLAEGLALRQRLDAEREHSEIPLLTLEEKNYFTRNSGLYEKALLSQKEILAARSLAREGQTEQLKSRIQQSTEQISGEKGVRRALKKQSQLVAQELQGVRELHAKGFAPMVRILALERESANLEGQLAELTGNIARLKSSIGETRLQLLQVEMDFQKLVLSELKEASSEVQELKEQIVSINDQLRRTRIRSPVDGKIQELMVHTIGGVIRSAEALLKIIPHNMRLMVKVKIDPLHIDQVYTGQSAFVSLSSFNQKTVPHLEFRVRDVSSDLIWEQHTGQAWYEADLEPLPGEMEKVKGLSLVSGMPAEAFIRTSDRTVLNYLLSPLTDQIQRAFREE